MDIEKRPNFLRIYQVDCFNKEFRALFGKDNNAYQRYESWLKRRLQIIDKVGAQADGYRFEKIDDEIYSIRSTESTHNPRVLYATIYIHEENILLLGAFLEKDGSDYAPALRKAHRRLTLINEKEETNNDS